MKRKLDTLKESLDKAFGNKLKSMSESLGQLTIIVDAEDLITLATQLREDQTLGFEQLIDLCGVDYSRYGNSGYDGLRFAAVSHLLSIRNNWRLRVRVFAPNDDMPVLPSLINIWNSVNWYEREAFDLYGIIFEGHPDLRRILTDYGFIGHPFRKDFPLSGYVEMQYDTEKKRVIYQPITIESREITPRVIRDECYGGFKH
ncbi:NADH-quinone oxidoreductase subunit C [Candidatus Vallotiella sp. (ex Adelges kitamiensis)]|uniref:NADH-quinone oxidoreductase subunit C n=1 Tax=Candidatus Vallotiella sp. (ex Adelges kitamiensis) TaxID=2864217 RepID=UPI001CE254A5|nr:NADH-quinone oxidoreductase subunit C [Candidatus Vallotia sp. (ex Adelges kitamiensis)]